VLTSIHDLADRKLVLMNASSSRPRPRNGLTSARSNGIFCITASWEHALSCWDQCNSPIASASFRKFHRVAGRFYVAGVFLAVPLGFYILSFAAFTDVAIWMLTTAIAMYFILKGKVQLHRQRKTRSFAVAIVFLEVRVVLGATGLEKLGDSVAETVVWMCVAFSLLFADGVLQWQDLRRSRPAPARVQPVPAVQTGSD
jgi:hypothetical protein